MAWIDTDKPLNKRELDALLRMMREIWEEGDHTLSISIAYDYGMVAIGRPLYREGELPKGFVALLLKADKFPKKTDQLMKKYYPEIDYKWSPRSYSVFDNDDRKKIWWHHPDSPDGTNVRYRPKMKEFNWPKWSGKSSVMRNIR